MRLTAEQIAAKTEHIDDTDKNRAAIRKLYHAQDESHLWPIRGRFNLTTKAAKKVGWFEGETGQYFTGLEYCYILEDFMSQIANDERNW